MGDSTSVDFCRYYNKNDSYGVMFSNKDSLSVDAVEAIFSKYGEIKEVHQTGSSTGICVVKFAAKLSAVKCISDVPGRKPITLRKFTPAHLRNYEEERKHMNKNVDKKNEVKSNTSWGSARLEAARNDTRGIRRSDDAAENENIDSQMSNSKTKEHSSMESVVSSSCRPAESLISPKNDQKDENHHKDKNPHEDEHPHKDENDHKNEDFGKTCDIPKESSIVTSNKDENDHKNEDFGKTCDIPKESSIVSSNKDENDYENEDFGENCDIPKESSIVSSNNDSNNDNQKKLLLISENQDRMSQPHDPVSGKNPLQSIKIPKRPPKLVLRKPKSFSDNVFYSISQGRVFPVALKKPWQEEPIEHVIAQEVIVGNIDLNCDVQFILDLFEEHEPLLASSMKLDEKNSFQCCHVYFKTKWQAGAVESRWDNAEICGRNIIVLRAETLAQLIR